jgi:hypothetical protein
VALAQDAQVSVLLADYIGLDAAGKINALGAGFTVTGVANGLTPPQHVAALIDVPSSYAGQDFALSVQLRDETVGRLVQVPGQSGLLEALRMQQVARAERPNAGPGVHLPQTMFARVQVALAFPMGLPLVVGNYYAWQVEIDGQSQPHWQARFYVAGPPPGPVFGGPSGPASIPPLS